MHNAYLYIRPYFALFTRTYFISKRTHTYGPHRERKTEKERENRERIEREEREREQATFIIRHTSPLQYSANVLRRPLHQPRLGISVNSLALFDIFFRVLFMVLELHLVGVLDAEDEYAAILLCEEVVV